MWFWWEFNVCVGWNHTVIPVVFAVPVMQLSFIILHYFKNGLYCLVSLDLQQSNKICNTIVSKTKSPFIWLTVPGLKLDLLG